MNTTRHDVASVEELRDGGTLRVELGDVAVALVRLGDDVYAIGDVCTHQDVSLAEGEVDPSERTLECWKHGSAFSLVTGEPESLPATRPVPVYTAGIDGDRVWIEVGEA